jgi:integrase
MTVQDVRRTCAKLLVDLEVHRAIMRILRHADVLMTLEIYANANSTAPSDTLRRLGESLR